MNSNSGALSFEAIIADTQFMASLSNMERRIIGLSGTAVRETSKIDSAFKRLGNLAVGAFAFGQLAQLPAELFRVRSEFQSLEIAFGVMLRSKTKADAFLREGVAFAATTPFGLKEVANAQKQLLAYGFAAQDVIPALKRLGDISAGVGLPLERLTYLYGTTKTQGRLFAQDLNQFVGSGIPLIGELAKQFGVTEDKVRGLVESGKVGFAEVKKAIESMTSGSGLFTGTLDAQSKSLLGLKERLGDAYDAMLNDIGKKNQDIATGLFTTATEVVQNYQQVVNILGVVAATYGTYRAALLLNSIAQSSNIVLTRAGAIAQAQAANSTGFLTLSQIRLAASTALLTRAQVALNAALSINPFVLLGTIIAALTTGYLLYKDELIQVKTAQELLADTAKDISSAFNKQKSEITTLVNIIKNQNVAESERLSAYEKLKSINPDILRGLDFQKAKTTDLTKAVNEYLISLDKKIRLESGQGKLKEAFDQDTQIDAEYEKARKLLIEKKKIQDLAKKNPNGTGVKTFSLAGAPVATNDDEVRAAESNLNRLAILKNKSLQTIKGVKNNIEGIYTGKSKDALNAEIAILEQTASTITDKLSPAYKLNEDRLKDLIEQRKRLAKAEKDGAKAQLDSIGEINAKIRAQQDLLGDTPRTRAEAIPIQAEIARLEAQKRRITGEQTNEEKRLAKAAAKEAEKSGPYGSIDYWETISKKAQEIIEKAKPGDSGKIAQQIAIKHDADRKVEELRKQYAIKSFDEELSDKRTKYELYQKWVDAYGTASAENQFATLKQSGQTYLDYLNAKISELEARKDKGKLSEPEAGNLGTLIDERDGITGKKTSIDLFQEGLEKARLSAGNLAEYLVVLKQKQDELNNTKPNTKDDFAIRQQTAEEIVKIEAELQSRLQQFLASYASSGEQQLAIQKDFAEKRAALDKKYGANRGADYQQTLKVINDAEKQAFEEFQQRKLEETDEYKKLTKVIEEEGRKGAKIQIDNQQAVANKAKEMFGVNSEVYKKAKKDLDALTKSFSEGTSNGVQQYATLLGQFGQALSGFEGKATSAGEAIASLSTQISLINQVLKSSTSDSEKYALAIQATIDLISSIGKNSAANRKKEADATQSLINQQQQYNLLLNEQKGIQSQEDGSVFIRDYAGEVKDSLSKYSDAQTKFQESLKKLNEGRAKAGLKNSFDANNFLKSAGTGAVIGGVAGPIGAVVGGIIGAVFGLFSSNKKVDEFTALLSQYPELIVKTTNGVDELNSNLAETLIAQGLVDDATKALLQSSIDWQKQMEEARKAIQGIVKDLAGGLGNDLRNSLVQAFEEGTSAADAFGKSVSKTLEDVLSNLLFNQIFAKQFKVLQDELEKSFATDGVVTDDFGRFYSKAGELSQQFYDSLEAAKKEAANAGLNIFSKDTAVKPGSSLTGAIKGVTEETASVLAGQINAIRITQADTNLTIKQHLIELSQIRINTGKANQHLETIADTTDKSFRILRDKL